MEIDGNLVIRWSEADGCEVGFVPAEPVPAESVRTLQLADAESLREFLIELGIDPDRVVEVVSSNFMLQSLRIRVDRRVAERLGLLPSTPLRRAWDLLTQVVTPRRR